MGESQEIASVFEQIREDLMHAVPKSFEQEAMFAGGWAAPQSEAIELLRFYSLCTTDLSNGVCGLRQIHRVVYELVKGEDSTRLYRTATPVVGTNRLTGDEAKKAISEEIEDVKISFHDGRELMPSFSSQECLPVYVKLEFTAFGQMWPLTVTVPCGTTGGE